MLDCLRSCVTLCNLALINFWRLDIDECVKGDHNCSKHARCKNSYGGYSCECLIGFEGDGETCTRTLDFDIPLPNTSLWSEILISICISQIMLSLFSVSEKVIIGTSVAAGLLLVGICLILIITGSVKVIGRRLKKSAQVATTKHQRLIQNLIIIWLISLLWLQ